MKCFGQPGIIHCVIEFSIEDSHGNIVDDFETWQVNWYGQRDTVYLKSCDSIIRPESQECTFFVGQHFSTRGCIEVIRGGMDTMRVLTPHVRDTQVQLYRMPFVVGEFEIPELVYMVYSSMNPLWRQRLSPHLYRDWEKFRKGAPLPYRNLVLEQVESFDQNSRVNRLVPYGLDDCYLEAVDLYNAKYWFNDENNFFRVWQSMKTFIPKEQKDTSSYEGIFLTLIQGMNYYFLDSSFHDFSTKITRYSPIYYGELEIPIGDGYDFQKRQGKFKLFTRLLIDKTPYVFGSYPGLSGGYKVKRGVFKIHFDRPEDEQLAEIIKYYRRENGILE